MQNETQYNLDKKAAIICAWQSNNLDKVEYLTGEDLGLRPDTIEQAGCEYSPLDKIFNKDLDKNDKKKRQLKRLKNIEDKIKNEDKKELEPIKNEEQSKIVKDESTVTDKKPKEIVLLKDKLELYLKILAKILIILEKMFLKRLVKMKKKNDFNNLFFEIEDKFVVEDVDFV